MKSSNCYTPTLNNMVPKTWELPTPFEPTIQDSDQVTHETRPVSGFTGVDFQAAGDMSITMGEVDSVVIVADDNILPLLKTEIIDSQLIISAPANVHISEKGPIHFWITMKKLVDASMSGTGDMHIDGLDADLVRFDLSGTGTITANGKARTLIASLPGMGFILCIGLEADTVIAHHSGTGEIIVRAEHSLEADITSVGAIKYYGHSADITKAVTGYGKINQLLEPGPRYF